MASPPPPAVWMPKQLIAGDGFCAVEAWIRFGTTTGFTFRFRTISFAASVFAIISSILATAWN